MTGSRIIAINIQVRSKSAGVVEWLHREIVPQTISPQEIAACGVEQLQLNKCLGGGIGIRARLKIVYRKV